MRSIFSSAPCIHQTRSKRLSTCSRIPHFGYQKNTHLHTVPATVTWVCNLSRLHPTGRLHPARNRPNHRTIPAVPKASPILVESLPAASPSHGQIGIYIIYWQSLFILRAPPQGTPLYIYPPTGPRPSRQVCS